MSPKLWSRNFIFLLTGNLFVSIAFYFLITALPLYLVENLSFSNADAGIILSAYIFTAVLIRPFAGPMLDIYGRKTIYLMSLVLYALLFSFYPYVLSLSGLVLLRIFHGIAWGVLTTAGNTIVMDMLPNEKRGEGVGYYGLAFTIAMAFGPFLASIIVETGKFQLLFISATVLAFTGLFLVLFIRFPKKEKTSTFNVSVFTDFIAPATFSFAALTLLVMLPYGAFLNFITIFCYQYVNGFSSIFFLMLAIGLTFSRIFIGKIFDKQGPFILLLVSYSFIILSIPILVYLNTPLFLGISAFFLGIGYGIAFPVMQLMINSLMPIEKRGIANSIFLTSLDIGIVGGTVIMGFMSELIGLKSLFALFIIFPIVCIIYFLAISREKTSKLTN